MGTGKWNGRTWSTLRYTLALIVEKQKDWLEWLGYSYRRDDKPDAGSKTSKNAPWNAFPVSPLIQLGSCKKRWLWKLDQRFSAFLSTKFVILIWEWLICDWFPTFWQLWPYFYTSLRCCWRIFEWALISWDNWFVPVTISSTAWRSFLDDLILCFPKFFLGGLQIQPRLQRLHLLWAACLSL